ncbi:MAG: hypothetical protein KJ072_11540 [Verrucomicrobia bacterium]|nr:hypothetical protein [Verrucomicrobiota bacterium]
MGLNEALLPTGWAYLAKARYRLARLHPLSTSFENITLSLKMIGQEDCLTIQYEVRSTTPGRPAVCAGEFHDTPEVDLISARAPLRQLSLSLYRPSLAPFDLPYRPLLFSSRWLILVRWVGVVRIWDLEQGEFATVQTDGKEAPSNSGSAATTSFSISAPTSKPLPKSVPDIAALSGIWSADENSMRHTWQPGEPLACNSVPTAASWL